MYEIYCKVRDRLGLKDADIAREAGITKSTFSDWKNGRSCPKDEKLRKIAKVLGVSVEYLVDGKQSPGSSDPAEKMLISNFRNLSDTNKINLLKISEVIK